MNNSSKFNILSFQEFSLYANGGGSRILRRLYQGNKERVISLALVDFKASGKIEEHFYNLPFAQKKWMRWKLRNFFRFMRETKFSEKIIAKGITNKLNQFHFDVLHIVDHGPYIRLALDHDLLKSKPIWVSFHDDFEASKRSKDQTLALWNLSSRRLMISKELGERYCDLFGRKDYELITDGIEKEEISLPLETIENPIIVYFSGLLHIDYYELFEVLADALDRLCRKGFTVTLRMRGTQQLGFLKNRKFEIDYKPFSTDSNELKKEQDAATILYLPIKFSNPFFYKYSLSTKMVGYLGSPGRILYHGPADSAACMMLTSNEAAVCSTNLNCQDLESDLIKIIENGANISRNAKILAANEFDLDRIQRQFWDWNINLNR